MKPVCELSGIGKSYRARTVLNDLDLVVEVGEMVAVTGASGSGKSTLLNILGLLESPDRGTLRLFNAAGPRVGSRGATHLLRTRLGYLFQNYALIDNETVDYNLRVAQTYAAGSRESKRQARMQAMVRVGLGQVGRRKVYELSGGEQQRVAIARCLLKPCELILADEPTGSLDAGNRNEVLHLLRELNSAGKTIIIVTHDDLVAQTCGRRLHLPSADTGTTTTDAA